MCVCHTYMHPCIHITSMHVVCVVRACLCVDACVHITHSCNYFISLNLLNCGGLLQQSFRWKYCFEVFKHISCVFVFGVFNPSALKILSGFAICKNAWL